jgi:hypothetical protein
MQSRRILALAVAMVVVTVVLQSASATTAPSYTINVRVSLSDTGVKLNTTQAYRGWGANFIVRNVGRKPHKFEIGGLATPALAPGKKHVIEADLVLRGRVAYRDPLNPGPRSRGFFKVI